MSDIRLPEFYPLIFKFLIAALTLFIFKFISKRRSITVNNKNVCIVVLGDLGRSPRMNYHALSFANAGYTVSFIGYKESKQMEQIESNSKISILPLKTYPKALQIGPRLLQYVFKVIFLSLILLINLIRLKNPPRFILVQNPPSLPTLIIAYLYCKLIKSQLIIDWHNYGHTILALVNGPQHVLVKICEKMEVFFGKYSAINLCVTDAMKYDLDSYKIKAFTLYDKPFEKFRVLNVDEKHSFFEKLNKNYLIDELQDSKNTMFTELDDTGAVKMRDERPALIVSSSSWTEDEDFHILIDALQKYDDEKANSNKLPNIICILTGKGSLKEYYEDLFQKKAFNHVKVNFVWLDPQDYPSLLGCADLGISLHKSTSDLDLPMKVVDMFGTTLPVCALDFKCLNELVKNNENGMIFKNSDELFEQLKELLVNTNKNEKLQKFRANLFEFQKRRWQNEWSDVMQNFI